jgi:hypothetical protein
MPFQELKTLDPNPQFSILFHNRMNWINQLQTRWKLGSTFQVVIILVVFALTGCTVYLIKLPLLRLLFAGEIALWARILYYVIILPVYNILLLFYGYLFGQFNFFWEFEKRSFKKLSSVLRKK